MATHTLARYMEGASEARCRRGCSKLRTTQHLVDEKTHPEEPNKAHKEPKPVWTRQVIERKERERNKQGHCPGKEQEAVKFVAHLPP